jgi:hypothetical protein
VIACKKEVTYRSNPKGGVAFYKTDITEKQRCLRKRAGSLQEAKCVHFAGTYSPRR